MLRKLLLVTATALPAVLASYASASAAALFLTPPVVAPGSPPTQAAFGNMVTGPFSDTYQFTLTGASNEVSIASDSAGDISNFSIKITGSTGYLGVLTAGMVSNESTNIGQTMFSVMETATLTAGTYLLTVSGAASALTAYNGTASFRTLAVPGPIAGAGLVALFGFAGAYVVRRRQGSLSAA